MRKEDFKLSRFRIWSNPDRRDCAAQILDVFGENLKAPFRRVEDRSQRTLQILGERVWNWPAHS